MPAALHIPASHRDKMFAMAKTEVLHHSLLFTTYLVGLSKSSRFTWPSRVPEFDVGVPRSSDDYVHLGTKIYTPGDSKQQYRYRSRQHSTRL